MTDRQVHVVGLAASKAVIVPALAAGGGIHAAMIAE